MNVVVDATALFEYMTAAGESVRVGAILGNPRATLHAPSCLDPEVLHAVSKARRRGTIDRERFDRLSADLAFAPITRHDQPELTMRASELCDVLSAYDAFYVALAELLDDAWLLTSDERLARAVAASVPGVRLID